MKDGKNLSASSMERMKGESEEMRKSGGAKASYQSGFLFA